MAPGHVFKGRLGIPSICILKAPWDTRLEKWAEPSNRRSRLTGVALFWGFRDAMAETFPTSGKSLLAFTSRPPPPGSLLALRKKHLHASVASLGCTESRRKLKLGKLRGGGANGGKRLPGHLHTVCSRCWKRDLALAKAKTHHFERGGR